MEDHSKLLYLLASPQEPLVMTKGQWKRIQFVVPSSLLHPDYKPIATELISRFGEDADEQVHVRPIAPPDLGKILSLEKDDTFTLLDSLHAELAHKLTDIFLNAKDTQELLSLSVYCRERVNPYLFHYAFSVALMHRSDTKDLALPSVVSTFPEKFFSRKALGKAIEHAYLVGQDKRKPIDVSVHRTASYKDKEHKLFYFREDVGLNVHHWNWHQVYPFKGAHSVVNKDRRGELFYYMHEQMIARYNTERYCNGLLTTLPLDDFGAPIIEGYFPKLGRSLVNKEYAGRVENMKMHNITRLDTGRDPADIDDLRRWRQAITTAIDAKLARDENMKEVYLDEVTGIDILGNMVENSSLSVNQRFYGTLHNYGHYVIGYIHDPENKYKESVGAIGDLATAVRDPVFYRWHTFVNNLFLRFCNSLPPYTEQQLNYPGITVESLKVHTSGELPNILRTFWTKASVNIANGLNFQTGDNLHIKFTLLQHAGFHYEVIVNNNSPMNKEGTCRIFLAAKYDEYGRPWKFTDQKIRFIELDKFRVVLRPGKSSIIRSSKDSSVTIPFKQTYRDLSQLSKEKQKSDTFCMCGWPHNLLIPRGTPEGYPCELFVMISDYKYDKVNQVIHETECKDAYSYCGTKDKLYPDKQPMGYPFNRMPRPGVNVLSQFLTPNMKVTDVKIIYSDEIRIE